MKKKQILEAATRLYLDLGYGAVSMDLVAREAKVSKATLYAHFTDKSDLFKASLAYYYQDKSITYPELPKKNADNMEELSKLLKKYLNDCFKFYSNDSVVQLYRLLIAEIKQFPELFELFFSKQSGQMTRNLADYLQLFLTSQGATTGDCYLLACQVLDLVRGASIWTKLVQNPAKFHLIENREGTLAEINLSAILLIENFINRNKL